jgi:hypothetical protein
MACIEPGGVKRLADSDAADHVFLLTLAIRLGPVVMLIRLIG